MEQISTHVAISKKMNTKHVRFVIYFVEVLVSKSVLYLQKHKGNKKKIINVYCNVCSRGRQTAIVIIRMHNDIYTVGKANG